jgi:hypothetical protein
VQESQDEDLEAGAGLRQPGSPGGSSRGGRLTQGLYRTSSGGSTDGNLLVSTALITLHMEHA